MRLKLAATSLIAVALATGGMPVLAKDAATAPAAAAPSADAPAPVSKLVDAVSIPYQEFTLDNGLRVLVHTDRKAPVVAVSVWYGVGSKNEPKGKTGFAHLFEHLMFNGSEHSPGDFFEPLQQVGATDYNGTTWFDRTNYFETVPTGALDRALMLESDRMGYLLGAVTQEKLDNQRSVVQNEKRQGDNRPYGMVEYEQLENLYPSGHPYHHSTIGSMGDLDSASLEDVKAWFRDHYGPNNAVLVLAGDIDLATAKAKVAKWFGAIPAGPKVEPIAVPVPDLPAPVTKTIYDQVPTTRIYRMWAVPGLDNPDYIPLSMGASVLGGLASSRLDNVLVREKQLAVRVSASADIFAQGGQFVVFADAKPGVSDEELGKAIDDVIADFLKNGPTRDELQRATTSYAASQIRGLESVGGFGGKAPTLAQGLLYSGDPAQYKTELELAAAMTPQVVKDVTAKWLERPVFTLIVKPGERKEGGENRGGYYTGTLPDGPQPAHYMDPAMAAAGGAGGASTKAPEADRSKLPAVGELKPLDFPAIQRAKLSNGIPVYFARRAAVPVVNVRVSFDVGYSADPIDAPGVQSMMLSLMDEGTTSLDSTKLAEARERLGAQIYGSANSDTTSFGLNAVAPNLGASLDLLADYVRHPAFAASDLERVRTQQVNRIEGEMNNPGALGQRALAKVLYGDKHPYGMPPSGLGDKDVVAKVTRDQLVGFHSRWISPSNAKIFVVGDTTLEQVMPMLEKSFGQWKANKMAPPTKDFSAAIPAQTPRIILIDRPKSPQSVILAGRVLPFKGTDDLVILRAANEVFGGNFLSRINTDLRETKGWSYGVGSAVRSPLESSSWFIYAPVQADRTGDSITALLTDLADYTGKDGVKADELSRLINGNVRELPGQFETSRDVLGGVINIVTYGRPDDYYETLASKYEGLTAGELDAQARASFKSDDLVFVVVGDAAVVKPQLDKLGWKVETMPAKDK